MFLFCSGVKTKARKVKVPCKPEPHSEMKEPNDDDEPQPGAAKRRNRATSAMLKKSAKKSANRCKAVDGCKTADGAEGKSRRAKSKDSGKQSKKRKSSGEQFG